MARRWLAVGLAAVGAVAVGRAELPRHTAKPRPVCALPGYDYRIPGTPPPTVTAVSLVRVPAGPAGVVAADFPPGVVAVPTRRPPQVFQFLEPRLQIGHCFLSRVAVTLHEDGTYQIGCRADQNPRADQGFDPRSPLRPGEAVDPALLTGHLRGNLFVFRARAYANAPVGLGRAVLPPGQPVVAELPAESFWVQRGEPYAGFFTGRSEQVRLYFAYIDRVEVEFTFR